MLPMLNGTKCFSLNNWNTAEVVFQNLRLKNVCVFNEGPINQQVVSYISMNHWQSCIKYKWFLKMSQHIGGRPVICVLCDLNPESMAHNASQKLSNLTRLFSLLWWTETFLLSKHQLTSHPDSQCVSSSNGSALYESNFHLILCLFNHMICYSILTIRFM